MKERRKGVKEGGMEGGETNQTQIFYNQYFVLFFLVFLV